MQDFIIFQYPAWFLLFCVLLGLVYSLFFYYRNNFNKDSRIFTFPTIFMFSFRFLSVFFIAFLLLAPLLRDMTRTVEEPTIAVLADNTQSIVLNEDSQYYQNDFPEELQNFLNELGSGEYQAELYAFSNDIARQDVLTFDQQGTNISKALDETDRRYFGRNLGAIVLATDGIYNQGRNPLFVAEGFNAPVYTMALGDTTPSKDLLIEEVIHNRVVYSENEFQTRVRLRATGAEGEEATLTVSKEGSVVKETDFTIDRDDYFEDIDLILEAGDPGLVNFHFQVTELEDEINYENNSRQTILEVLESKQEVLFVTKGVHPDIQSIRSSLERQDRFEVSYSPVSEFYGGRNLEVLEDFRMVLLHGIPSANPEEEEFIERLKEMGIPLFFVISSRTDLDRLNDFDAGFQAESFDRGMTELFAEYSGNFTYFHFPEQSREMLGNFPPVDASASSFSFSDEHEVLIESRERRRGERQETPLMFFMNRAEQPVGIFNGEGMWRWFNHNFRQEGSHRVLDDLWFHTARFLAAERDRERFRVYMSDRIYNENERVEVISEFYNETFQPVQDADIFLEVTDEEGQVYDFNFHRSDDHYVAPLGRLDAGNYQYRAYTEYGGDTYQDTGMFAVEPLDIESLDLIARHDLLKEIAEVSNGGFFGQGTWDELLATIRADENIFTVSHREYDFTPVIHQKWLFFLIMMFVSAEWFMRKYFGSY